MISRRAKELIPEARTLDVQTWKGNYNPEIIEIIGRADDEKRYLTDEDLAKLKTLSIHSSLALESVRFLRDNAADAISTARQAVLENFPKITAPEGDLYPPERAEACWRDFWHFLRCITYGIAAKNPQFTSPDGLEKMRLLYEEMRVPLPAMLCGLKRLKSAALDALPAEQKNIGEPYFDHLIEQMAEFIKNG
ncbi:phycobilisome protein [Oscillatoria sp. FACHB-1406]|uniref:phycobilisome protein n=1 Tax=Oscillatoria sp. FACHB-1406 TaxID=2692846 RepID=UPI00168417B4|nr:phycobilisome protein [Oscillatoria sp. FACHB-1406]MBD2579371.1 phycobilisome protein [Oscillatoria sp. FACHB-1406]